MAIANLRLIKDGRTTQNCARAGIEAYTARLNERISPWPIPVCNGSYLDVDAILARSLPKVSNSFTPYQGRNLSLVGRCPR